MFVTPDEWLARYRSAWIARDPEAAAALFTEDATYLEQPYGEAFVGQRGVRDYWERVTATQGDVDVVYGTPVSSGNRTAVEWWVTLTNDGAPITLAGEFMLTFDESGLCRTLREYWHFTEGAQKPPSDWGS
jgi:nuclear transport factor 2 (NTF2) superfamily protein